jgi:4-amino-4-deoxy-L-arabinose transferase-like glycosyltransferase
MKANPDGERTRQAFLALAPKARQRRSMAASAAKNPRPAPDHFNYMTAAWRKRRGRITGLPEDEGVQAPAGRGLRGRLGVQPYHRNPAHVLLAHPGVIAALIIALALVLRVVEVQRTSYTPTPDGRAYLVLGGQIANGGDYSSRDVGVAGSRGPTAFYAPAYPYLLGALDFASGSPATGASQIHMVRLTQAVLGAIVVGLIGLIALELFGVDMALLAMALAAIYPAMIELSSVPVPDTLLSVFELGAVWTALRTRRSFDPFRWMLVTGLLTGLAALTHPSAILLVIPLGIAVSSLVPVVGRREVGGLIVLLLSVLLALSPWLARNALVMHRFVAITDGAGVTLAQTYNAASAHSSPAYQPVALISAYPEIARHAGQLGEAQLSNKLASHAFDYMANHPSAPLSAAWHNSLRMLELEGSPAWHASAAAIGVSGGTAQVGVIFFWVLGALALLGVIAPTRFRAPGWLWGVPIVMWLGAVFVNGGTPQFRAAVDPFLILLATRGIARVAMWIRSRPATAPAKAAAA